MISLAYEFRKTPFLKLLIPFIFGIICQLFYPLNFLTILVLIIFAFIILLIFSLTHLPGNFRFGYLWGLALYLLLFASGLYITEWHIEKSKLPVNILDADASVIEIADLPVLTSKSVKASANIIAYRFKNNWYAGNSKCNIYIAIDSSVNNFSAGDRLLINTRFRDIDGPISPYQFDFKKYFYYKGIQLQISTGSKNIIKLSRQHESIKIKILNIRSFLVNKLSCPNMDKQEKAVVSSLVLGFTGDLDPELRNSYARAGVMHILSVSGMHVGIVYCFLLYLLFFLDKTQKLKILKSVIIIIGIWFYAMVTGFSPPVIRSAAMFSFFAVGQAINRNSNGFNSLAASAFIILLINPFQITDLGFQLSYAAIAGILLFYHPVYNAWNPTHWMVDKIWALIAVSVAAQLGTLPLSLYYFHQFPTYFIPTNLVIVPLSGLIIYAGLALLILSFWPLAFSLLSFALKYLLASLNWLVVHVEFLPGSSIQNIYLSATETLVVAAMILIIAVWIKKPLQIYVFFFLSFVLTFTTLKAVRLFSNENQKLLVIHNTRKHVAFSLINNHECLMLADSIIIKKVQSASVNMMLAYNVKKCYTLYMQQIKKDTSLCLTSIHCFFEKNLVIQIEGIRLVFLCDKRILKFSCQPKQYADYLILNENSGITINEALNYFNTPKIITGFGYKSKPVKNEFRNEKNEISIFFVNEQGIYKADL